MKLVIATQYMENYGAHDWDGKGECPQYWKCKGGSEYIIENVPFTGAVDYKEIVEMANVERNNEYVREYVIDWVIADDDYVPNSEKLQLEYEGKVIYFEPRIDYNDLSTRYAEIA